MKLSDCDFLPAIKDWDKPVDFHSRKFVAEAHSIANMRDSFEGLPSTQGITLDTNTGINFDDGFWIERNGQGYSFVYVTPFLLHDMPIDSLVHQRAIREVEIQYDTKTRGNPQFWLYPGLLVNRKFNLKAPEKRRVLTFRVELDDHFMPIANGMEIFLSCFNVLKNFNYHDGERILCDPTADFFDQMDMLQHFSTTLFKNRKGRKYAKYFGNGGSIVSEISNFMRFTVAEYLMARKVKALFWNKTRSNPSMLSLNQDGETVLCKTEGNKCDKDNPNDHISFFSPIPGDNVKVYGHPCVPFASPMRDIRHGFNQLFIKCCAMGEPEPFDYDELSLICGYFNARAHGIAPDLYGKHSKAETREILVSDQGIQNVINNLRIALMTGNKANWHRNVALAGMLPRSDRKTQLVQFLKSFNSLRKENELKRVLEDLNAI